MKTKREAEKEIKLIILCAELEAAAVFGNKEEAYKVRQKIYKLVG